MAEALCVDSWSRQRQESNQQFYSKINEMRAWMGMPLVEVPSYETKKEESDYLQSMRKACERAAEYVERMKRWPTRSQDSVNEADVAILGEHSDQGGNADLEAKPAKSEVNSGPGANVQQREILEWPSTEIRAPKGLFPLEMTYYEFCESGNPNLSDSPIDLEAAYVKEREPTPICLEVDETNLGLVYIEVLETPSSMQEIVGVSQEKENEQLGQIDDLRKSKMRALEVLDFDYNKLQELEPHTSSDKKSGRLEVDKESIEESIREFIPSFGFQVDKESSLNAYDMLDEMPRGNFDVFQTSKVIFKSLVVSQMASVDGGDVFDHAIVWIENRVNDCGTKLIEFLDNLPAYKMFVGIPTRAMPMKFNECFIFDPGGVVALLVNGSILRSSGVKATRKVEVVDQGLQWDPGGLCVDLMRFCIGLLQFCVGLWRLCVELLNFCCCTATVKVQKIIVVADIVHDLRVGLLKFLVLVSTFCC